MDAELKPYLDEIKLDLGGRVDAPGPRLGERIGELFDASEDRLTEFMLKSALDRETRLVAEFRKWSQHSDALIEEAIAVSREVSTSAQLLSERLLNVEERLFALERGRL
jgi:hypothetical protein